MVLTTRAIEFVTIDISAPGMQQMRSFMREKGKKREGQRNVLPPQIFNGEERRGVKRIMLFWLIVLLRITTVLILLMKMMAWKNFLEFHERILR